MAASIISRKGGIPNQKLRNVNEADFFQKNTTTEKGFTFNYDGTLVDFKKPAQKKDLFSEFRGSSSGYVTVRTAKGKMKLLQQSGFKTSTDSSKLRLRDSTDNISG